MTNFTAIIKNVSNTFGGLDHNYIILMLIDLMCDIREGDGKVLLSTVDEGDGNVVLNCYPMYDDFDENHTWCLEELCTPYSEILDEMHMPEEDFFEFALETMHQGGCISPSTPQEVEWNICWHKATWFIEELDVIVLSNGEDTVTYYNDAWFGWKVGNHTFDDSKAAVCALTADFVDGYYVVFKGVNKEVK